MSVTLLISIWMRKLFLPYFRFEVKMSRTLVFSQSQEHKRQCSTDSKEMVGFFCFGLVVFNCLNRKEMRRSGS